MSWWVMEQVSVNEAGTQTLANIQCDNVSDLPTPDQSATLGYIIVRGSQAKVLATSENYILGSTGTWVKMEDGVKLDLTGYATEQYVDDGLADKVDTSVYSSGQAAQDAMIATKITMEGILGTGRQITDTIGQDELILGKFYCANAADAGNVSTAPWSTAGYFGFTMRSISSSQRFVQIAIRNDDAFAIAKRRYIGIWQPWSYITNV